MHNCIFNIAKEFLKTITVDSFIYSQKKVNFLLSQSMKSTDTKLLHAVWESSDRIATKKTAFDPVRFDDFIGSIFCPGPFCFFVIDFFEMKIISTSPNFNKFLYSEGEVTLDSVISTVHPEDIAFVAKAEQASVDYLYNKLGRDKVLKYKVCYCFRAKSADGDYRMFSHQAIALTTDEKGNFGNALNIVTDISHLTATNNYKFSMIGIAGEPSFLNIDAGFRPSSSQTLINTFSNREIEIVKLISEGLQSKEIASRLNISLHTVHTHRKNILEKSGLKSTGHLISRCM